MRFEVTHRSASIVVTYDRSDNHCSLTVSGCRLHASRVGLTGRVALMGEINGTKYRASVKLPWGGVGSATCTISVDGNTIARLTDQL